MSLITDDVRAVITAGRLAHLVTLNPDGSPQISLVWIGLDGDDLVVGHLMQGRKITNLARDPRVSLSIETGEKNPIGLDHYLVVHGTARLDAGGAPALLQRLAHTYLGPDVTFPPFDEPPPGTVIRITAERITGVGPWAAPPAAP